MMHISDALRVWGADQLASHARFSPPPDGRWVGVQNPDGVPVLVDSNTVRFGHEERYIDPWTSDRTIGTFTVTGMVTLVDDAGSPVSDPVSQTLFIDYTDMFLDSFLVQVAVVGGGVLTV